jgi:Ca2+-dependent lipid-binding protein
LWRGFFNLVLFSPTAHLCFVLPPSEFGIVDKKGEWVPNDKKDHKCAKSKTLRKTLAPVWRTPFDFTIDSKCKALRVQVWDWDYVGASEFMGEALIPLSEMPVGKEVEGWYKLNTRPSKPREVVSGEIYLRYLYTATGVAADANVSEEERVALDDIRSGEIELIVLVR